MSDTPRKKLIEVALPLDAINAASAREKSLRHGHPSTLHLWWSRKPLATCRAVLYASLVDDPSDCPHFASDFEREHGRPSAQEDQDEERERIFAELTQLVKWENSANEGALEPCRARIRRCCDGKPPPVLDPFCGGGSIPLEAQRLGLEAHASDLNPVAVLITTALIGIPPKFARQPPVNPDDRGKIGSGVTWKGAVGLAADVRYYGKWMRDEAERRIGYLYPKAALPEGSDATVIAWLWARTVRCPNPACGAQMPLTSKWTLSTKASMQIWAEPQIDRSVTPPQVRFKVKTGYGKVPEGTVNRRGAACIACGSSVSFEHIRAEGKSGHMGQQMMAIVAEREPGREYLAPKDEHVQIARSASPEWKPEAALPHNPRDFKTPNYGMQTFADLFTPRQLVALTTFSDLVGEARERAQSDAAEGGLLNDAVPLTEGGIGARAYGEAVATYLGLAADRMADRHSSLTRWDPNPSGYAPKIANTFSRQALPMIWDYAEGNPFSDSSGNLTDALDWVCKVLRAAPALMGATCEQSDATSAIDETGPLVFSTDPPYYDNIGYADLSDFFYVWLRRSLHDVYPDLFATVLAPKSTELVATPYRFGGSRKKAEAFFRDGLSRSFQQMRQVQSAEYPLTVYYAFKQSESDERDGGGLDATSTGWETMLSGLIDANFSITGTWPMRSELTNRMIATGTNSLASSIVLVCRPRLESAETITRQQFIRALRIELPSELRVLVSSHIAPVDLAQALIGPGMAIFSRYKAVLEADGSALTVRPALALINQALDELLADQDAEYDPETRWAIAWFEQFGTTDGPFGTAETLSRAKNTAINRVVEAGIVASRGGNVRLQRRDELPADWNPELDRRLTVWEVTQHLIRALDEQGEHGAADILAKVGTLSDAARDLAYRLYTVSDRKKWTQEALAYNSLVVAWPEITRLAAGNPARQGRMLE